MRILHTADWHLGQRLNGQDRFEEHQQFLDWLLQSVESNSVDAIVVAGDIFDTANPSSKAQEQYYEFLGKLSKSSVCHDIIIVGGNHDNPNLLNAPRTLLKALSIHIVGAVPENVEEQCVLLPSKKDPRLVVAAVPFLREGDISLSTMGESIEAQESRIRKGIAAHYDAVANCVKSFRDASLPVLVTGHLFAMGGDASESSERTIHVGKLGQVTAEVFSDVFDYVALGHLHKHQIVGGYEHIRYSGSPIPLSFSEADYSHQVLLLDFEGRQCPSIRSLPVPRTRKLLSVKGPLEEVVQKLREWDNSEYPLQAWADVQAFTDQSPVYANDTLDKLNEELHQSIVIVNRKIDGPNSVRNDEDDVNPSENADLLKEPRRVFARLLDVRKITDDAQRSDLLLTFDELLSIDDSLNDE
jgi:exonuclease SbcD